MRLITFFVCFIVLFACSSPKKEQAIDHANRSMELPAVVDSELEKFQHKSLFCVIDSSTISDTTLLEIDQELVAVLSSKLFKDDNFESSNFYIEQYMSQTETEEDSLFQFEGTCYAMGRMQVNDSVFALFWKLDYSSETNSESNEGILVFATYFVNNKVSKCFQVAKIEEGERFDDEYSFEVSQQTKFFNGTEFTTEYIANLLDKNKKVEENIAERFVYRFENDVWTKSKIQ